MTVDIFQSVILGVVQGITEWLPISSSGHLALTQLLLNIEVPIFFDLILHLGTLIGVVGFYRKDILGIFKSVIYPKSMDLDSIKENRELLIFIIVGTIPTAIIAFGLKSIFVYSFYSFFLLSIGFFISGIFILMTKYLKRGSKKIGYLDAIIIGIAQGFSVFSSISRSGITISIGMMRQIDHDRLVKYSFLLSIPAIIGGSLFDLLLMDETQLSQIEKINFSSYLTGFVFSGIVGYISIILLINIVKKGSLFYFSYYCFGLGAILLIASFIF
jgi:undecaprenyl-diphosphatase